MSLGPSRPLEDLEHDLAEQGFRPASPGVLRPDEVDRCRTLHCLLCREPEPDCRAYERVGDDGVESRAVAVCRRCAAAEVLPRSCLLLSMRRADERPGWSALGAVAVMAGVLVLAGSVHGDVLLVAVIALATVPVAFLAYLARNGPGGGGGNGTADAPGGP